MTTLHVIIEPGADGMLCAEVMGLNVRVYGKDKEEIAHKLKLVMKERLRDGQELKMFFSMHPC